jgi:acylglycerol lipase
MNNIKTLFKIVLISSLFFGCATASYQTGLRPKEASVTDANHQEGRFSGAQNTNLFEQSWKPLSGPTKGVLIIVHGLKDHSDRYAEVARKLTQNGFAVYAFDLRGHGDSEGRRVWTDSFDDYITDLELFYDYVRKQEPNQPIYLFGHSMGGAIITTFVLKHQNLYTRPVEGMVLSAPALKPGEDINGFLIGVTKMLGSITPSLAVLDLDDDKFSRDPKVVQEMKNDPLIYQGKGPARTAKELLKAIANIQEHMTDVTIPFIALHGTKDGLTNPDGSRELFKLAKAKDKSIRIYEGLYHDLLHEPEKDKVYGDMVAWLNTRAAKHEKKASVEEKPASKKSAPKKSKK